MLIAGGRLARLTTLLTLRALMAEGLEITMPAPARKFIKPSISAAQPFDPQRVALRLADTASALGAWCDRRMLDRHDTRGTARAWGSLGQPAADLGRARQAPLARRRSPVESASKAAS